VSAGAVVRLVRELRKTPNQGRQDRPTHGFGFSHCKGKTSAAKVSASKEGHFESRSSEGIRVRYHLTLQKKNNNWILRRVSGSQTVCRWGFTAYVTTYLAPALVGRKTDCGGGFPSSLPTLGGCPPLPGGLAEKARPHHLLNRRRYGERLLGVWTEAQHSLDGHPGETGV